MFTPRNGVPYNNKLGMKDNSVAAAVASVIGDPIHKPLMFVFSPKGGTDEAFPVAGGNAIRMFGAEIFAPKGKYTTFNTPFAASCNEQGNEMMMQRLETPDGKTANARAVVEVLHTLVDIYERDGAEIVYDSNGQPKVKGQGMGYKLFHYLVPINEANGLFKNGRKIEGTKTGTGGDKSMIYPLYDTKAPYFGESGNHYGWSIEVLTSKSTSPVEPDYHYEVGSRVYQFKAYEQTEPGATPATWPTLLGGDSFRFAFKEGAYYKPMRLDLDYRELLPGAYREMSPPVGMLPTYGIFEDFHFYEENMLEIVAKLQSIETTDVSMPSNPYLVDIFNGVDMDGHPYEAVIVNPTSESEGTVKYSGDNVLYMQGGSDGTMNDDVYDQLVREQMSVFGYGKVKYDNELKYSLGILWDSGFSFDTKEKLVNFIVNQKSTFLCLSTHVYNQGQNDEQTEEAAKVALAAMISIAPESVYHGTAAGARAIIVGQSYQLLPTVFNYKPFVPMSYSICKLLSKYAGAKDPRFNPNKRFTRGEHTIITDGNKLNVSYKPMTVYSTDWDVGLISARNYDYHRFFIPALSTAFKEESSVVRNFLFSFAMTWVQRVSDRVWAECTGEGTMTDAEYAKLVEDKINEKIGDRLDVIANVTPRVYFTEEDKRNGNTAHIDLLAEGNPLKTQHTTTIVVSRKQGE